MRAALVERYGPVEQVRVGEVPVPRPGRGRVLLRVEAAGVNPADVFAVTGSPFANRLATGLRRPRRTTVGTDVAGTIEALGAHVTGLRVGDRVFGAGVGTFAERCVAPAARLAGIPAGWTAAEAAAVPMAGTTALQVLEKALPDPAGRRLLVIGAGGGIGTFLVPLASGAGASVVGACSAAKRDLVLGLGAAEVIDYRVEDVAARSDRFDAIVDNVAAHRFRELLPLLAPGGVLVTNSGTGRADGGALGRPLRATLQHLFLRRPVRAVVCTTRAADLVRLADLGAAGALRPVVGSTHPLADAAEALGEVASGHATGKVVVLPG